MTRLAVVAFAVVAGCAPAEADQLLVRIVDGTPGGLRIPEEIDAFELRVASVFGDGSADDDVVRFDQTFRLSPGAGADGVTLPQTLAILPAADGSRVVRVTLIGLRAGEPIVEQEAISGFGSGLVEISLALRRECFGIVCPTGQTCVEGECEDITVPTGCDPTQMASCVESGVQRCVDGVRSIELCARCVSDASGARCLPVVPSNVGSRLSIDAGSSMLTVDGAFTFRTGDGSIVRSGGARETTIRAAGSGDIDGIVYEQLPGLGGGTPLAVFAVDRLEVTAEGLLNAAGPRALVLLVRDEVIIGGGVRAGARSSVGMVVVGSSSAGPGGGDGSCDAPAFEIGEGLGGGRYGQSFSPGGRDTGGAGASFGGRGGDGGGVSGEVVIARAAEPYGSPELIPIYGGSGGGPGGDDDGGCGGAGGGAIQISAGHRIELFAGGYIDAGGRGGRAGRGGSGDSNSGAGGGGGSGGAILLEAPVVVLDGLVGVYGGGGGQGSPGGAVGTHGGDAFLFETVPAAGSSTMASAGGGGSGSDATGNAMNGLESDNAGGGGGGAGRIRINTTAGTETYPTCAPAPVVSVGTVGTM